MRRTIGLIGMLLIMASAWLPSQPLRAMNLDAELWNQIEQYGSVPVIVGLKTMPNQQTSLQSAQTSVLAQLNPKDIAAVKQFQYVPAMALSVNATALERLATLDGVTSIVEDHAYKPTLNESTARIGAPAVWALGYKGQGQTVAILDTGVQANHPFFAPNRVVAEACFSTNQANLSTSLCPNGQASQTGAGAAAPCTGFAACNNGTHVAGIAAGYSAASPALSGVAPEANIIAVQIYSRVTSSGACGSSANTPCLLAFTSDQINALEYVLSLRNTYSIAAVNFGLGDAPKTTTCDTDSLEAPLKVTIDNLRRANIATITAAGDNGRSASLISPACISSSISVGATTEGNPEAVLSSSNSASFLTMLAPGENISSSIPAQTAPFYGNLSGTSMAAAHVTGAWAVMRSKRSDASVDMILDLFKQTGVPITDARNGLVKPRLQLDAAIEKLKLPSDYPFHVYLPFISSTGDPLVNGDFELGNTGWLASSSRNFPLITNLSLPTTPRSGAWLAWLGRGNSEQSYLSQVFDVPNTTTATLQYFIQTRSSEANCSTDLAWVYVNGSLKNTIKLCSSQVLSTWTQQTIDLSAYRGLSVHLQFIVINNDSNPSSLLIDDVSLVTTP